RTGNRSRLHGDRIASAKTMRPGIRAGWVLALAVAAFLTADTPTARSIFIQAPASNSGAISGVVVDTATNAAVAGALVQLAIEGKGRPGSSGSMLTDAKGRFVFVNLPPSDHFTIGVS